MKWTIPSKQLKSLEKNIKNILKIRKVKNGKIFTKYGFIQDSHEKITRFVLFIPIYQKNIFLIGANEFRNTPTTDMVDGGGGNTQ